MDSEESANRSPYESKKTFKPPNFSKDLNEAMEDFMEGLDDEATTKEVVSQNLEEKYDSQVSKTYGNLGNADPFAENKEKRLSSEVPEFNLDSTGCEKTRNTVCMVSMMKQHKTQKVEEANRENQNKNFF